MEKIRLYILCNRDGKGIYKTAFKNKEIAIRWLKVLQGRYILRQTMPIFNPTDTKAYYATYSYSEVLGGNTEIFGVTLSKYISPTKERLYTTDPCIKEISKDDILYQSNDLNFMTINDDNGYYHFHIESIDIV